MPMTHTEALTALHAAAIAMAGPDYRWTNAKRVTVDSKHMRGLTILLAQAQGGICAACGDPLDGAVQYCHIVASRRQGIVAPGNGYAGHAGCNDDDYKVYGDVVPLESLVRADVVQTALPTRKACHEAADAADAVREARRARRLAL